MILLCLVLAFFLITAILFASNISGNASKNLALSYALEAAEKFHLFIVRDLVLVQKAARSNALTNWFADEFDDAKREAAYHEIIDYAKVFDRAHLYFGIHNSLDEYSISAGTDTELEDFNPFDRLDRGNPADSWYFDCISAESDYILKIGSDKDIRDRWQLWIYHKVMDGGQAAGVFGSGLPIQSIIGEMFTHHYDRDLIGFVVDNNGHILMDSVYASLYGEENRKRIHEAEDDPKLVAALDEYLGGIDGHFDNHFGHSKTKAVELAKGAYGHAAIAPINHSDWSVVIFYNNKLLNGVTDIINLLPLLFFMILALLLYVVGGNALMRGLIFVPLSNLTKSVSETRAGNAAIFGSDRDDEIGELSRTILDMRNTLSEYIANLRKATEEQQRLDGLLNTVNITAGILLRSEIKEFDGDLHKCMGMIGGTVDVDRIYIFRNSVVDGKLCCCQVKEWSGVTGPGQEEPSAENAPYSDTIPRWEMVLSRGECINSLVRDLPADEREMFLPQGILSVFVMPIFVQDKFWGFIGYDDCQNERLFSEGEQTILWSGGILIANAILRHEIMMNLHSATGQMEQALAKARDASRAKSNFLANTSHEMRTPLNAILGLSELTLEAGGISGEARTNLEKVYNAGATLLSTVNDILDISKIEAGKLELAPIEYSISSMINDTVNQSIFRLGDKPVEFILNISENLPSRLYGDDMRVRQVISNLLSNAFKYTREGQVELEISCAQIGERIVWMDVIVRDTGIGIMPEDITELFTEYTKAGTGANRAIEGTGLGLPITKKLTEMMSGFIHVESEYGKGSVFSVRLRQESASAPPIGPEVANNLKNLRQAERRPDLSSRMARIRLPYARVLVVDDVITNLDVAKGLLKLYGIQVDCVASGQEAIDAIMAEKVTYDAVFMDHMMPKMDGIEAAERIRKLETDYARNIPIIALTANAIMGTEEMFLGRGFQGFISKPIELSRLDAVVHEYLWDEEKEQLYKSAAPVEQERRSPADRRDGADRRSGGRKIAGLDMDKGISRFGGEEEVYLKVLESYAVHTRSLLEKIAEANNDNLVDYAIAVHGIKGSSRGIYAAEAGARAEDLENAAKDGDLDFIAANNPAFVEMVGKLITDIEAALEVEGKNRGIRQKNDRIDPDAVSQLAKACKTYDIDGIDAAMEEIERFEYGADDELAKWLREKIDQMDYAEIVKKLSEIQNG